MSQSNPVPPSQRLEILDILRGFALLGILLANSANFSLYFLQSDETKAAFPFPQADRFLDAFHEGFIDGKFYVIFSLLFGIGFSLIFFGKQTNGRLGLFYRRLFFLMIIGLIHSLLIWEGDILGFYAVVGAILPLFRNVAPRKLIWISIFLMLTPLILDGIKVATDGKLVPQVFAELTQKNDDKYGINDNNFRRWLIENDSYAHLTQWNRSGFTYLWHLRIDSNRIPKVLAMFILGLAIGKLKLVERFAEFRSRLQKLMIICFLIGVPAAFARMYFDDDVRLPAPGGLWDTLFYLVNVPTLSIAYSIAIALYYNKYKPEILKWLQSVGRMALTNYMMQSVISICIYYGIGFRLGGQFGPSIYMPIAILIFIAQVFYSKMWLSYFNYGPAEWIWRQLTYGKRLKLRRVETEALSLQNDSN